MSTRAIEEYEARKVALYHSAYLLSVAAFVLFLATGCSADKDRSRSLDLAVKGSYIPGETGGTRNQLPHGGIDEKSDPTPTKPVE